MLYSGWPKGKFIGFDGFDLYIRDYDSEPGGPRALYWLGDPEDAEEDAVGADYLVDGLLLGPGNDLGDSAVQSISWARIKASLEPEIGTEESFP